MDPLKLIPSPTDHLTPKPAHSPASEPPDTPEPPAIEQALSGADTTNVAPMRKNNSKQPEVDHSEYVLYCGCGNRTWYMHMDGIPRCAVCNRDAPAANPEWYKNLPPMPADPLLPGYPPEKNETSSIVQWNTEEQAKNYLINKIDRNWSKLTAVITIYSDGFMSVWTRDNIKEDAELRGWYERRMEDAWRMMISK